MLGGASSVAELTLIAENQAIRDWAEEVAPRDPSRWDFRCECGDPDCAEHVKLTLREYDRLRRAGEPLFAPDHVFDRARAARAQAREMHAEAHAVRNQAQQQARRTDRLRQHRHRSRYRMLFCRNCGYGVCVPQSPDACPMCHSTMWREPDA